MLVALFFASCALAGGLAAGWVLRSRSAERALLAEQKVTDEALCRLIDHEVREVMVETGRSQALLRDAVGRLNTSFGDMVAQTREQGGVITRLVEPGTGSPGVRRFAAEAGGLIVELAGIVENSSRESVRTVQAMDDTVQGLDQLFTEVTGLAVVAGTAATERMRARIRACRAALDRTRALIEDSAEREMSASVAARLKADALVAQVTSLNHALADGMQVVTDCSDHIRESVSLLVRSLQFEDITTQSLGTANAHLERLQDLGREAARVLSGEEASAADRLASLRRFGEYLRTVREGPVRKPISQTALETGAVDLF